MDFCWEGDEFVVWKLDRFGRPLRELIDLVNELRGRGVEFASLQQNIRHDHAGREARLPRLRGGG